MSALTDKHNEQVLEIAGIVRTNLVLAGIDIDKVSAAGIVRTVLDNYKPVGVWSDVPEETLPRFSRPGRWRRWDIRIGNHLFNYRMFQHELYRDDPGYERHVMRTIKRRMGESIAAWIMNEPEPNPVADDGGATSQPVGG
jgi:hypothetical protein